MRGRNRAAAGTSALVAAGLLFCSTAAPTAADLGGFTIADYHSDLTVAANSDLDVSERIAVDFSQARHGIYRRIPIRYTDPHGYAYSIGFRLLGVQDEAGKAWPTSVSSDGPYVQIRIGDPDRTVIGRQVYVLRYHVKNAVKPFPDHDELYWNAVGDEWQTSIADASATVLLPSGVSAQDTTAEAYVGPFRSAESATQIEAAAGQIDYRATRPLQPREGMTIVAAWPPGYIHYPSTSQRMAGRLLDNWIILAPLVAVVGLVWTYRRSGRDPRGAASVTVQYEPPAGVSPGELGTIVDESVDLRDITATVVDLAIKGHLAIKVEQRERLFLGPKEETSFERASSPPPTPLLPHEQMTLDGLFESGDRATTADLRQKFYESLPGIRDAIYGRLVANGYFARDPSTVRTLWIVAGLLLGLLVAGVGIGWALLRGGLLPYVLFLPIGSGICVGLLTMAFAKAMPRRTETGVAMRLWALGFEEFVDRVESDRLARDQARQVFEALLPYAMALGVAAKWARQFEGIYADAPPRWYVGPLIPGQVFSTAGLEHSVSASMAATAAVMATTPRSSGSSGFGGGFSGGGFGGGGGGSW